VHLQSVRASAPGKAILLGEHAVVYGRPALAVPVSDVRAWATVEQGTHEQGTLINAIDFGHRYALETDYEDRAAAPLQLTVRNTLDCLAVDVTPNLTVTLSSQIPIARGMGSGPAVATAIVRSLCAWYKRELSDHAISDLVYETEMVLHGTPSGIDNTVVALECPIYFCRCPDGPPHHMAALPVGRPLTLIIADTGQGASTWEAIDRVRRAWQDNRVLYGSLFGRIGDLVERSRTAIAQGNLEALGEQMNENQAILQQLDVSNTDLDSLILAARLAGALGAKLSGGGLGGCMIALVRNQDGQQAVSEALRSAGAAQVFTTTVRMSQFSATDAPADA